MILLGYYSRRMIYFQKKLHFPCLPPSANSPYGHWDAVANPNLDLLTISRKKTTTKKHKLLTISNQKLLILRPMFFHNFSVTNYFLIDQLDF